jgi:hypothetical protein
MYILDIERSVLQRRSLLTPSVSAPIVIEFVHTRAMTHTKKAATLLVWMRLHPAILLCTMIKSPNRSSSLLAALHCGTDTNSGDFNGYFMSEMPVFGLFRSCIAPALLLRS